MFCGYAKHFSVNPLMIKYYILMVIHLKEKTDMRVLQLILKMEAVLLYIYVII